MLAAGASVAVLPVGGRPLGMVAVSIPLTLLMQVPMIRFIYRSAPAFLPIIAVTPYALAHKLSDIAQLLSRQFLKVLLPIASVLQGMAKHRRLAIFSAGSGLANLGLSLVLVIRWAVRASRWVY